MVEFTFQSWCYIADILDLKKQIFYCNFIAVLFENASRCVHSLFIFFINVDMGLKCRRRLQNFNVCPDKSQYSRLNRDTLFLEFCHSCSRN